LLPILPNKKPKKKPLLAQAVAKDQCPVANFRRDATT
jgi:hypothetical protein